MILYKLVSIGLWPIFAYILGGQSEKRFFRSLFQVYLVPSPIRFVWAVESILTKILDEVIHDGGDEDFGDFGIARLQNVQNPVKRRNLGWKMRSLQTNTRGKIKLVSSSPFCSFFLCLFIFRCAVASL